MLTPEQQARVAIYQLLSAAGWAVQDVKVNHVHAARGVDLWEFELNRSLVNQWTMRSFDPHIPQATGCKFGEPTAMSQGRAATFEVARSSERLSTARLCSWEHFSLNQAAAGCLGMCLNRASPSADQRKCCSCLRPSSRPLGRGRVQAVRRSRRLHSRTPPWTAPSRRSGLPGSGKCESLLQQAVISNAPSPVIGRARTSICLRWAINPRNSARTGKA